MLQRESINTSIAKNIPFEPTRPRVFFRGITNEIAAEGRGVSEVVLCVQKMQPFFYLFPVFNRLRQVRLPSGVRWMEMWAPWVRPGFLLSF